MRGMKDECGKGWYIIECNIDRVLSVGKMMTEVERVATKAFVMRLHSMWLARSAPLSI